LEAIAKGATKGFFEHWEEKFPQWLSKIKNHELRFIQDPKTYEVAKRESGNKEYQLYSQVAAKGWPRVAFKLGLALREIEGDPARVQMLKDDIVRKHGIAGVHAAELAQKGILSQLIVQLSKILGNPADVKRKLNQFLDNVDELVSWVKKNDEKRIKRICELVKNRVDSNPSQMAIVLGSGYAQDVVWAILKCVRGDPRKYYIQVQQDWPQLAGFVFAPELTGQLTYWSEPFAKT